MNKKRHFSAGRPKILKISAFPQNNLCTFNAIPTKIPREFFFPQMTHFIQYLRIL